MTEITPQRVLEEANMLIAKGNEALENRSREQGLFDVQTARTWLNQAKNRPIPKMLFGPLWYEGELCILFADTNLGKSILAVQIANSISKGEQISVFKLEAEKQSVLYFDFELVDKQFEARYSVDYQNHYEFDDSFSRAEINHERSDYKEQGYEDFDHYLNDSFEKSIIKTGAKVLIIDNITYLKDETEKAKFALQLMKRLLALKKKHGLSILALAHTPKRDKSKPITNNDLQGSKMISNFTDSSFAMGKSSADESLRYIKQIKARNTEIIYDADNVCICQVIKPNNFLQFEFMQFGKEYEHLKQQNEDEKTELENSVRNLLQSEPGITTSVIAKRLCNDMNRFPSFNVKISRIVKRINNNVITCSNSSNISNSPNSSNML